jgi:hypothetical protein
MKLIERENEVIKIIKQMVESKLNFIVVGGYAVSALAKHRFSVDCDIVIPKKELKTIEDLLVEANYSKNIEKFGFDKIYGGSFVNYMKKVNELPVTADVLVDSLVNRNTNASWSFDYIKQHSVIAIVTSIQSSVECKIPKRELLIAMKIHSARKTDIRDIIMLNEKVDWLEVLKHLKRGKLEILKDQTNNIIKAMHDERLVDSLKGVFILKQDVNDMIAKTIKEVEMLREKLS